MNSILATFCFFGVLQVCALEFIFVSPRGKNSPDCGAKSNPCAGAGYALLSRSKQNATIIISGRNGTDRARYVENLVHPVKIRKSINVIGEDGPPILSFSGVSQIFSISKSVKETAQIVVKFKNIEFNAATDTKSLIYVENASLLCESCRFRGAVDGIVFQWWRSWPKVLLSVTDSQFHGVQNGIIAHNKMGFAEISIKNCSFTGIRGKSKIALGLSNSVYGFPYFETQIEVRVQAATFTDFSTGISVGIDKINLLKLAVDGCEFRQHSEGALILKVGKSTSKVNVTITDTVFHNNSGDTGAALNVLSQTNTNIAVIKCFFAHNTAYAMGGAVAVVGNVVLSVQHCNFSYNRCSYDKSRSFRYGKGAGGALGIDSLVTYAFSLQIVWSTFEGNTAPSYGGTIYAATNTEASTLRIEHSNISAAIEADSRASVGDAIYSSSVSLLSDVHVTINKPKDGKSVLQFGQRPLRIDSQSTITCAKGFQVQDTATSIASNEYRLFSMSCRVCPYNHYSTSTSVFVNYTSRNSKCEKCTFGGECVLGTIRAKTNFWGYKNKENGRVEFIRLKEGYGCVGKACKSYDSCMANRVGKLCAECRSGLSENFLSTKCIDNNSCKKHRFWIISSLLLFVYVGFFLYKKDIALFIKTEAVKNLQRRDAEINKNGYFIMYENEEGNNGSGIGQGLLKILFYFYQVQSILGSERTEDKSTILQDIRDFASRFFNFRYSDGASSASCFKENAKPVEKLMIQLGLPSAIFIVLILLYAFNAIKKVVKRKNRNEEFSNRVLLALFEASLLCYAVFLRVLFQLMSCVTINGKKVLLIQGNIGCSNWWQNPIVVTTVMWLLPFCLFISALPFLLLRKCLKRWTIFAGCIFPMPWLIFHVLWFIYTKLRPKEERDPDKAEKLQEDELVASVTQVLTGAFKRENDVGYCCYWEGMMLLRRLILTATMVLLQDIYVRFYSTLAIQLVFLLHHVHSQPYNARILNVIETASLAILLMIGSMNFLNFLDYNAKFDSRKNGLNLHSIFTWVQVVIALIVPAVFALVITIIIVFVALLTIQRVYNFVKLKLRSAN